MPSHSSSPVTLPVKRSDSEPFRLSFVCTGNICRSPMADVVFRRMVREAGLDDRIAVRSSGTGSWHLGEGADPRTVAALKVRGFDGSSHIAAQFAADEFAELDLILALDRSHLAALRALAPDDSATERIRLLRDFDPKPGDGEVPDPYYGEDARFGEVLAMIERSCAGLLTAVTHTIGASVR
ncbi:low molecular weight protein-tyrosine-phosphatase [Naasia lichenicola]|uniref:protein-tyrosine-phosphatase n=1 Tax=Naasia lichenicola TaxID=2565933 RepID=A0A4S4FI20_9MICO|nr:low molecular weight protein-tyrosine-phosphatase [Naasia lichenicola]THG29484.1 low molecular weight phosphotyrosine protein phosphatase [Naasia lichenicola]